MFSALFHASVLLSTDLAFSYQPREGIQYAGKPRLLSSKLMVSGHVLVTSSNCLCLLLYLWDFKERGFSHDAL